MIKDIEIHFINFSTAGKNKKENKEDVCQRIFLHRTFLWLHRNMQDGERNSHKYAGN